MNGSLHQPISSLPRTAARTIKRMQSIGIETYFDLINHFPFRYEDYSRIHTIDYIYSLAPGVLFEEDEETYELFSDNKITIKGQIESFKNVLTRRGAKMQKAVLRDSTGKVELTWFNQLYLAQIMKPGTFVSVSGVVKEFRGQSSFQVDEYEVIDSLDAPTNHTAKIIPIYPQVHGLSTKTIREKIAYVLTTYAQDIQEMLPDDLKLEGHPDRQTAFKHVHFPDSVETAQIARERLAFDELFTIQLSSQLTKKEWEKETVGHVFEVGKHQPHIDTFTNNLPFTLTQAQQRAIKEILNDFAKQSPMNRLLQGDVGSGKTVVAALGIYVAYLNGFKSLLMAPTEILAKQHYASLIKTFSGLEASTRPSIALLTAKSKPKKKELDKADFIIGTHALISTKVDFSSVGFVVIDEQHKFGVVQRAKLKEKGSNPHLLSMTATPIPRTVTLTLYGELDVSIIDEMPRGRKMVKTYFVLPHRREDAYTWIKKDIIHLNTQVFVVCPLIEESEAETLQQVKAATVEFENLKKIFSKQKLGLLHGRQKAKEKDKVMKDFSENRINILVSTPVVEVGIDIPNATVIIIEAAERFGLAQLHQLRGRVGRSDKQSYCLLFTDKPSPAIQKRLKLFSQTHDGFKLAQYDLEHRGAGNIYGTQQHGSANLNIASLGDLPLIELSNRAVHIFFDKDYKLDDYSVLKQGVEKHRIKQIARD